MVLCYPAMDSRRPDNISISKETFEKCSILFKFKEGDNFNRRNTLSISRIKNLSLTPKLGKRGRFAKVSYKEQV